MCYLSFGQVSNATRERDQQISRFEVPACRHRGTLEESVPRPERRQQHDRGSPAARPTGEAQVAAVEMQRRELWKRAACAVVDGNNPPLRDNPPLMMLVRCHARRVPSRAFTERVSCKRPDVKFGPIVS